MRVSKRGRPGSEGDNNVSDNGGMNNDGSGSQGKGEGGGVGENSFVFGSMEGTDQNCLKAGIGSETINRRPMQLSYKEKLLTVSGAGYLMNHDEEEDIVNGWRTLFARKNAEVMNEKEGQDGSDHAEIEDECSKGKYPELVVTADQYKTWCKPWMNSLIIKLLGSSIPKQMLIDRVKRMWKPQKPLKIMPLSNDYYVVSFSERADRDYAFQEGPWMINDHYLLVQKWRPNFNPWKADTQRRIAAWVRIPDLPIEFYSVEALGLIGNMIGKTIKIDRSTSIYEKGGFARICVEIDLQKPLLPAFKLFGETHQLVYEGLHLVCFECGKYGHEKNVCPSIYVPEKEVVEIIENDDVGKEGDASSGAQKDDTKSSTVAVGEKQKLTARNEGPAGSDLLGPQMILRRNFRHDVMNDGIKEKLMGRRITNKDYGRVVGNNSANSKGRMEKVSGAVNGNNRRLGKDIINDNTEWVIVGSKSKQEEKQKASRKESRNYIKTKSSRILKTNQKEKVMGPSTSISNSFIILQDGVTSNDVGGVMEHESQLPLMETLDKKHEVVLESRFTDNGSMVVDLNNNEIEMVEDHMGSDVATNINVVSQ